MSSEISGKPRRGAHLAGYGGRESRYIREARISKILRHIFFFHVLTPGVLAYLTGTTKSNCATLLKDMVESRKLQKVNLEFGPMTPEGYGYMLTENGVVETTKGWYSRPHPYDTERKSVRQSQLEHDLTVAMHAATIENRDGSIVATDYSVRSNPLAGQKIADLIFDVRGQEYVFEFERTLKKDRDVQIALIRLARHKLPVVVACDEVYITDTWREFHSREIWPEWQQEKSVNGGRWQQVNTFKVTAEQRARITILDAVDLPAWLDKLLANEPENEAPPPRPHQKVSGGLSEEDPIVLGLAPSPKPPARKQKWSDDDPEGLLANIDMSKF